jgi:hypothetical protein
MRKYAKVGEYASETAMIMHFAHAFLKTEKNGNSVMLAGRVIPAQNKAPPLLRCQHFVQLLRCNVLRLANHLL